eukprot:2864038-Rhodomonas_salina.2
MTIASSSGQRARMQITLALLLLSQVVILPILYATISSAIDAAMKESAAQFPFALVAVRFPGLTQVAAVACT